MFIILKVKIDGTLKHPFRSKDSKLRLHAKFQIGEVPWPDLVRESEIITLKRPLYLWKTLSTVLFWRLSEELCNVGFACNYARIDA